jgi:hypothetical protein
MSEGRRFTGIPTERIAAGGGFEEWFEVATTVTTGDFIEARRSSTSEDSMEMGMRLMARLVRAWSMQDAAGAPVPITYEAILALPWPLVEPVFTVISERMRFFSPLDDRELTYIEWALTGSSNADVPADMLIGLIMARTGRLPDEIERQDYGKLIRAWQIVCTYDKVMRGREG